MASDTGTTGKTFYLLWNSHNLSANYRATDGEESIGFVDASAGADTDETHLTTLKSGTRTATLKYKASDTAIWGYFVPGTSGTLEWGPDGTAATKPRNYVTASVASRKESARYNELVVIDVSWRYNGAVTDGTY